MPCPGAVVVWSGITARVSAYRAPFTLGRSHATDDDRISNQHVEIGFSGMQFVLADKGSRNGTFVDGHAFTSGEIPPFSTVRAGRTLAILVPDVRPYEHATLVRRGSIWCATSLAAACATLETSAHAEDHVGIFGPMNVGRALARHYAEIVGGEHVVADLNVVRLGTLDQKLAGATPRTMILELERPLTLPDQPELEAWLETDVRIVSVARDRDVFKFMPRELMHRMLPRAIDLPPYRFDELPGTFAEILAAHGVTPHATLIEAALLRLRSLSEESLLKFLDHSAQRAKEAGVTIVRGSDLDELIAFEMQANYCIVGKSPPP